MKVKVIQSLLIFIAVYGACQIGWIVGGKARFEKGLKPQEQELTGRLTRFPDQEIDDEALATEFSSVCAPQPVSQDSEDSSSVESSYEFVSTPIQVSKLRVYRGEKITLQMTVPHSISLKITDPKRNMFILSTYGRFDENNNIDTVIFYTEKANLSEIPTLTFRNQAFIEFDTARLHGSTDLTTRQRVFTQTGWYYVEIASSFEMCEPISEGSCWIYYEDAPRPVNVISASNTHEKVFTSLTEALKTPDQVTALDLHFQGLTKFPLEILQFRNLRKLNLSLNFLEEIPAEIDQLQQLEELDLSGNQFFSTKPPYSRLSKLRVLRLAASFLNEVHNINQFTQLEELDLEANNFEELPKDFELSQTTCQLNLKYNVLTKAERKRLQQRFPNGSFGPNRTPVVYEIE